MFGLILLSILVLFVLVGVTLLIKGVAQCNSEIGSDDCMECEADGKLGPRGTAAAKAAALKAELDAKAAEDAKFVNKVKAKFKTKQTAKV